MKYETRVLLDGLGPVEAPRWHDSRLWFSDFGARKVMTVDLNGKAETIVEVPQQPSGLGWLPDGRLLVVSMRDRRLLRLDSNGLSEVADLSRLALHPCNDMVVDSQGRAYIGHFGFDFWGRQPFAPAGLILVTPDGNARIVAEDMAFPNGTVITPDGRTLIVGETYAARLTAFNLELDGSLGGRRIWAQLEGASTDGICLDAEGAVWVASPISPEVLRVREGGEVTHRIAVSTAALACMLGGPERRTLFIMAVIGDGGRIEVTDVDVPGAGLP
jgi:sugar lactone lactonase YvrE